MKINLVREAVNQGRRYVRQNPDKVKTAAAKAGQFADQRTGGKYTKQITKATTAAEKLIDKSA